MRSLRSRSPQETFDAGRRLASRLQPGDCVLLAGSLGAGKTVFAKGLAAGLGADPSETRSPTFTLVNIYAGRCPVYHIDLYRIEKASDLEELGLEEMLGADGVAVVEWPERLGRYLPRRAYRVRLRDLGGEERAIAIDLLDPVVGSFLGDDDVVGV